jgi:hypothetical protein
MRRRNPWTRLDFYFVMILALVFFAIFSFIYIASLRTA